MPGARQDSPEAVPLPKRTSSPKTQDFVFRKDLDGSIDIDDDRLAEATRTSHHDSDTDSDATDSEDDFDWDAEDDARSQRNMSDVPVNVKRGRAVWRAFLKLSRPLRTLIIAVLGTGVLITPLILFEVHFKNTPGRVQARVWSLWLAITWATTCITYLAVDLAPMLVLGVFRLFSHSFERLQISVELISAVLGWLKLTLDVSWSWIALSLIRAVYKPPQSYWPVLNRVMEALFSASLLLLAEKIFLRYVAINFHRKALADRIAENQIGLRALDRLSNATPNVSSRKSPYGQGWKKGHRSSGLNSASLPFGAGASQASSSNPSPIGEKPEDMQYELEKMKEVSKTPLRKEAQKQKKRPMTAVIVDNLIKNQARKGDTLYSASKLARKLFSTLSNVYPPRQHLLVEDFYPYFKSTSDAQAAFAIFDKDGNGDISRKEMREAVRRIYRERRALTASLKDVGSAVAKLDAVLVACVLVVFIFIALLIFNRSDTIASLVPLATIILGFSFIFGHSAQTLFESLIFIFSTHVFDVGDLVMIDDTPMEVREFGLFSTTFKRVDGQEVVAPNALLASSKLVHNLRRSGSMWEYTDLVVSYDTSLETLEILRRRLEDYITDDQRRREWSNINLNIDTMTFQNAITLKIGLEHRPNWQDWGGRWGRRNLFMRFLKTTCEELDLRYVKPIQPILMPNPPYPPGWNGGSPRSPYMPSPRLGNPELRVQTSRDTLHVAGAGPSALGRSVSFRGSDLARTRSGRLAP